MHQQEGQEQEACAKRVDSPKKSSDQKGQHYTVRSTTNIFPAAGAISPRKPISSGGDLLGTLPMDACVELTRRLLTAVPTLPSGPARPRAVLKIVVLFVADYGSTA